MTVHYVDIGELPDHLKNLPAEEIFFVSINCLGDLYFGPETRAACQEVVDECPDAYTLVTAEGARRFYDDDVYIGSHPDLADKLGIVFDWDY
jgi:hypothetical protein